MIKKITLILIGMFLLSSFALAANFGVGDPVSVQNTGAPGLNVRDQPTTSGTALFKKFDGNQGSVLSGPTSANGYIWWKIRWSDGQEGYSADGDATSVWLTKLFVSPSFKFSIGNTAQVSNTGGSNLNVRGSPPDLAFLGTVGSTAQGTVVNGPFYGIPKGSSGFYQFWQVNFGSVNGWAAEDFLTKIQTATVPSAPQSLSGSAGDQYVSLSWSAPSNNGGAAITSYKVYRSTSPGQETFYATVTSTSFFEMSVLNGVTYYYKVSAVNSIGESSFSNEASVTPQAPVQLPNPPVLLSPTGTISTVTPTMQWQGVGGADQYELRVEDATTLSVVYDLAGSFGLSNSYTLPSGTLQDGKQYRWQMRSHNNAGWGSYSSYAFFSVSLGGGGGGATVSSAPTNLAASGATTVTLSWNVPSNNGGASITSYRVYRGTSSGGESFLTTASSNSYSDASVSPGTTYYYKVSAVNSVGESALSGEASITISGGGGGATVPGVPTNLAAIGTSSEIDLSWSAPSNDGGSAITNYEVYRGTSSGGETLYSTIGAGTTFRNTANVVSGTTYYYKIKAVNAIGASGFSNEASAQLQATPTTAVMTPELLAAVMATLSKEVPGSFLPIEENGDYGMGSNCTYKVSGSCRGTPYDGGVDYKGRGYIQITHKYNYQTYCGTDCIGTSTPSMDVCGCKNQWHCTVNDLATCPMDKALEPDTAARIFASYYNDHNMVAMANQKNYLGTGSAINGATYGADFKAKADAFLALFQANSSNTSALIQCLQTNTPGCGPQVYPDLFKYSSTLNTNLYQSLTAITVAFGGRNTPAQSVTKTLQAGTMGTLTVTYAPSGSDYTISSIDYASASFYGQAYAAVLDGSTQTTKWSNTFWNFGVTSKNLFTGSLNVNSLDQIAFFVKGWDSGFNAISLSDTGVFQVGNNIKPSVTNPLITIFGVKVFSPVELRAYDDQGHITGLINGQVTEGIPGSRYDLATEMVLSTTPIVKYELVGTDTGVFGINGETDQGTTVAAQGIPVNTGEIVTFEPTVDTIVVQVDTQGDGTVDATFTTDSQLTPQEFTDAVRQDTCVVTFRTSSFDGTYGKKDWIVLDTNADGALEGFEFQNQNAAHDFCTDKKSIFFGNTLEGYSIWKPKEDAGKDEEDSDDHEEDSSALLSVCNPADNKNRMLFHKKESTHAVTDTKMVQGYEQREVVTCLGLSGANSSNTTNDLEIDTDHSDSDSTKKRFFLDLKDAFKEKNKGKKNIKIKADNQLVVEFPFDFSDDSTSNVSIELRSIGKGGASVKGIQLGNERKTLHFPQLTDSNKICILDAEATLDEISADCTGENEHLIICDGSISEQGYTCEIVDKIFIVHGLKHSAVSEFSGAATSASTSSASTNSGGYGGGGVGNPGEAFRGIVKRKFDEKKTSQEVKPLQTLAQKTVHEPVAQEEKVALQQMEQEPVLEQFVPALSATRMAPLEKSMVAQPIPWLKWLLLPIAFIVIGTLLLVKKRRNNIKAI